MSAIDRLREYVENVTDWTCLEKLKLHKIVVSMLTFDFILSLSLLFPTTMIHFLYVNPAGRAGFVGGSWISHVDIYKFRRYQEWENYQVIDWEKGDRAYVNETRELLEKACSKYENEFSIPGDPGDYLKEVVGHPNQSGYNILLMEMIKAFLAAISIIYFSCPILLLALWWKKNGTRIIITYIIIQWFPMILFAVVSSWSGQHKMCAIDIIYGRQPVRAYLISFTVLIWLYYLVKFVFLFLYCIEQHLSRKRKDFGFRKRRKNKVAPEPKKEADKPDKPQDKEKMKEEENEEKPEMKVESLARKSHLKYGRKSQGQKQFEEEQQEAEMASGKNLAREILRIGHPTEAEPGAENKVEEQPDKKRQSIIKDIMQKKKHSDASDS